MNTVALHISICLSIWPQCACPFHEVRKESYGRENENDFSASTTVIGVQPFSTDGFLCFSSAVQKNEFSVNILVLNPILTACVLFSYLNLFIQIFK